MKNVNVLLTFGLFILLSITACKKDNSIIADSEIAVTAENQAVSSDLAQDAEDQTFTEIEERGGDPSTGCPTVTYANPKGTFPNTITIDFGTGCLGKGGRTRAGQIIVTLTDAIINQGAVRTATLQNYSVDGVKIEGKKTLTNLGPNASGNTTLSRKVEGIKVTFLDGSTASWDAMQTITYLAGFGTKQNSDDIIEITGSGTGINKKGNVFSYNILEPLLKDKSCKWIEKGKAQITRNADSITIDFGNGDCDGNAQLTLPNGKVKDILLHN